MKSPSLPDMRFARVLLVLVALAALGTAACGDGADRGESCGEHGHGVIHCAEGLECVWRPSAQDDVCSVPGDEGTQCEADDACNEELLCIGTTCHTVRSEGQLCLEDRQCEGALECVEEDSLMVCRQPQD